MALLFKELHSSKPSSQVRSWIHPSGELALLYETRGEASPVAYLALESWLNQQTQPGPADLPVFFAGLEQAFPWLRDCKAHALLISDGNRVRWQIKGPIGVVRVPVGWRQERKLKPELMRNQQEVSTEDDFVYLLASTSVVPNALKSQTFQNMDPTSYAAYSRALDQAAHKASWGALIFPVEYHTSYANPNWKRVRFVGKQEGRRNELWGLRAIGNALDAEPDFEGSCIVGGQHVNRRGSTIHGDGVLLSPHGIVLLEAKHFSGTTSIEPQNENARMVTRFADGQVGEEDNPIRKLGVAAREFKAQFAPRHWISAALVFTGPENTIELVDPLGGRRPPPALEGDVAICLVSQLAGELRRRGGRGSQLSRAEIDRFAADFGSSRTSSAPPKQPGGALRIGRFLVSPTPIAEESTPYCDVLDVRVEGQERRLWAKRYKLNPMTSSLESEAERVGREVRVLQDMSGEPGFYNYIERAQLGQLLYVIVERVEGLPLDRWLTQEQPTRERKLYVLRQLASLLAKLAGGDIVHRALSPAAVRVGKADRVTVVNFDFCQVAQLATLDQHGRAQLNPAYLSQEAATPGRKLTPADDTFSLGKLACLVLGGAPLPFETPGISPQYLRKPELWQEYAAKRGIAERELLDIRKMLAQVREERPTGPALESMVAGWLP